MPVGVLLSEGLKYTSPTLPSHAKVVPLTILASPWGVILDQSDSSFTNLKGISVLSGSGTSATNENLRLSLF